ncbi:phosphatidate cytidylyltransferase [Ideonella livida]|uniref:Phosphatidate cytidylyltransferase n=1 Tax=Ideonella livida TaxID=2707176 RepID=A0A7C9TL32_9BURK|nr:phosphatidate cytidylyltransferase [Ideonella livida]NDY90686.1 phosphatidate cytidylyltransferase [Ideonella livida]
MLLPRILTAIVLLAILIPAVLAHSPWPFVGVTLLMLSAGGWEWGRLNGLKGLSALVAGAVVVVLGGAGAGWLVHGGGLTPLWWAVALLWLTGGAKALQVGPGLWAGLPRVPRLVAGILALAVAWLALFSAWRMGLAFLASVCCLVWMADIAAYFGGRTLGRRKLAVTISPGKSWEGALTGAAGVLLMAAVWSHLGQGALAPDLFTLLRQRWGLVAMLAMVALLVVLSVMGDLIESLVKRAVGVKDSSGLLPGHGGVLDRIDALLPVLPAALALASLGGA